MIKRIIALISAVLAMSLCTCTVIATGDVPAEITSISTNAVLLYEANSGAVLYQDNANSHIFPASTTKILTAIIVIDLCEGNSLIGDITAYFKDDNTWNITEGYGDKVFSLDDIVTVTLPETRGSVLGLREGEKMSVRDLLYGMMLVSGNDCARALANHFSPDDAIGGFAKVMNAYAKELGAVNSTFKVPHGLHLDDHQTTAYDMALITAYALKNDEFRRIVATETYKIEATNKHSEGFELENTNRLIHTKADDPQSYKYEYAIGVKTGDTDAAGRCIVAAAEKDGKTLIAVLMGDYENSKIGSPRYENSVRLFDYGFNNFTLIKASELDIKPLINADIADADAGTVQLKADLENATLCFNNSEIATIKDNAKYLTMKTSFSTDDGKLHAPIESGDVVGTVQFMYKEEVVLSTELIATASVKRAEGNSVTGVERSDSAEEELEGYDWIFWLLLFCLLLVIILVIIALTRQPVRRRNSQLRRHRRR